MYKTKEEILAAILNNREQRYALRKQLSERGYSSVSLNFNIPGYPKVSPALSAAFGIVAKELRFYLQAYRISLSSENEKKLYSNCGDFLLLGITHKFSDEKLKRILEQFEETHPLGRLLDIDLYSNEDKMISSGKQKKCLLCEQVAHDCIKQQQHDYKEYSKFINTTVDAFLRKKRRATTIAEIAEKALRATLYEVAVEQKPGLVSPGSNGAHQDMDFFTFQSSSAALADFWRQVATLGYDFMADEKSSLQDMKIALRMLGMSVEGNMLRATNGVNTQKGIIFLIGLGCFAAGVTFSQADRFDETLFRKILIDMMEGIVQQDFEEGFAQQGTHGEACFRRYGRIAGGARNEAEQGFPTVFDFALDYLHHQIGKVHYDLGKEDWQQVLTNLLLLIISKNNDTNILHRKNDEILAKVKAKAARVLVMNNAAERKKALESFASYCMQQNISPGGAADLLALSLFVFFIEKMELPITLDSISGKL